jgi:DNA-binding transcriptional MerR regulator
MDDEQERQLTIDELAREAGLPVRTVRYYISQGLLPGPGARGRAATYDREHLAKLRLIRLLSEQHVPLAEQRERLADLSPTDVEALLRQEQRWGEALERASQAPSPRAYISHLMRRAESAPAPAAYLASPVQRPAPTHPPVEAQPQPQPQPPPQPPPSEDSESWRRWEIVPGVELHARADAARIHRQLIERLLQTSRESPGRRSEDDTAFEKGRNNA